LDTQSQLSPELRFSDFPADLDAQCGDFDDTPAAAPGNIAAAASDHPGTSQAPGSTLAPGVTSPHDGTSPSASGREVPTATRAPTQFSPSPAADAEQAAAAQHNTVAMASAAAEGWSGATATAAVAPSVDVAAAHIAATPDAPAGATAAHAAVAGTTAPASDVAVTNMDGAAKGNHEPVGILEAEEESEEESNAEDQYNVNEIVGSFEWQGPASGKGMSLHPRCVLHINNYLRSCLMIVGKKISARKTYYRVNWENYPPEDNTWEPEVCY